MRASVLLPLVLAFAAPTLDATPGPGVALVHSAEWNAGDAARDGAGEFAVFLRVAQLQKSHDAVALVAICDRNGLLRSGGERALRRVIFDGVVVAKLSPAAIPDQADQAFLHAGNLPAETARAILTRCLGQHGAPPAAADPENPTTQEIAAIHRHLRPFQHALSTELRRASALASR